MSLTISPLILSKTKIIDSGGGTPPPTFSVNPTISGTAVVGQTLSVSFTLNNADTVTRKWYRNGVLIFTSTTSNDYVLVQADAGNTSNIKCNVEGSNGAGSVNADSNTIARILDADANAYVTTVSGGLNSSETSSVNQLYIDLKSNNQLVYLDTLQIYAGPTNASALKPFIGSQTVTPVNSPSWVRKDGYTHTGTSYINTGFIQTVSTKFTRLSNCFGFGCSNKNTTTNGTCGFNNGNLSSILLSAGSAFFPNYSATQGSSLFTRTIANKDYANRRVDASNRFGFQDGTETSGAMSAASAAFNSQPMFVGALNNSGTAIQIFESGAKTTYFYAGSGDINPSTMRTIINNFINSL